MKRYRLIALIVLAGAYLTSFAEDYVNYFRKGTEWVMQTTSIAPDGTPHTSLTTKSIKGDTVVDMASMADRQSVFRKAPSTFPTERNSQPNNPTIHPFPEFNTSNLCW